MTASSVGYPGLEGRVIVVTGAGSGQGTAEARLLSAHGARVIATDRTPEAPDDFGSLGIDYRVLDVTDEDAWRALADDLASAAPIRGLVNNAGIAHRARLGATTRADWDHVLAVNLTGPMLGIQALAPLMATGSSIHRIGRRPDRALHGRLHGEQVGPARPVCRRRDRARTSGNPGEHRASWLHRDADDRQRTEDDARRATGAHPARTPRGGR